MGDSSADSSSPPETENPFWAVRRYEAGDSTALDGVAPRPTNGNPHANLGVYHPDTFVPPPPELIGIAAIFEFQRRMFDIEKETGILFTDRAKNMGLDALDRGATMVAAIELAKANNQAVPVEVKKPKVKRERSPDGTQSENSSPETKKKPAAKTRRLSSPTDSATASGTSPPIKDASRSTSATISPKTKDAASIAKTPTKSSKCPTCSFPTVIHSSKHEATAPCLQCAPPMSGSNASSSRTQDSASSTSTPPSSPTPATPAPTRRASYVRIMTPSKMTLEEEFKRESLAGELEAASEYGEGVRTRRARVMGRRL